MKTLVVFYSRSGNTKKIGQEIAKELKAETEEIISITNYNGFFGYIRGGFQAFKKKIPEVNIGKDPINYDLVVIGTPTWASTMAPPVRSYISKNKFKKIAFFSTRGGESLGKTFQEMEELSKKPMAVFSLMTKEVEQNVYNNKLKDFCGKLK